MIRALLAILFLAPAASAQDAELAELLDRMELRRKGLVDFRATVSSYLPLQLKTGVRDLRRWAGGPFVFRAPGDAAWSVKKDRADYFQGDSLDQAKGIKASVHDDEFFLHVPWILHSPSYGPGGRLQNYPYGSTWYQGRLSGDTPPLLPMLAEEPQEFPVVLLYMLAPRKYLKLLPSLKIWGKQVENGRRYVILTAKPADPADAVRKDEAKWTWNYHTWMNAEIWVDVAEARIDRMSFSYENCSSAPRFRYTKEYRFSRQDRIDGIEGIPSSIGIVSGVDSRPETWSSRIDLTDIKINGGVKEEEVKVRPPPERIVRDWFNQTPAVYEKHPGDAAAWLNLGVLRRHVYDHAGAEQAFRKVIELEPAAEEGYIAFASLVTTNNAKSPDAQEVLEKGLAKAKSDELRWIMAPRIAGKDPAGARKLLEGLRVSRGDEPMILEAIAKLVKDPAEKRAVCVQSIKAELAGGGLSWLWNDWKETQPAEKDKLALIKICEESLRKEDRLRTRHHLVDLYAELGKKDEVRKQARAMVALMEKKVNEYEFTAVDRIHEVLRAEKDVESLKRLEKAFAAREDDDGELVRLVLEAEAQVAGGDVESWVRYFDEKIMPPQKTNLETHWQPCSRFIVALKREKKLQPFLERLFLTPEQDENHKFHRFASTHIGLTALEGSEREQFMLRMRQLENGPVVSAQELLNMARTLVMEKKWKEAQAKAEEVVKVAGLKGQPMAEALRIVAQCHEAAGEFEKAATACARAREEKDIYYRHAFHMTRGQMFLALNNTKAAIASFALGFDDAAKEPTRARRWSAVRSLLTEIPLLLRKEKALKPLLDAAEAAGATPGMEVVRALLRLSTGNPAGAVEACEKARAPWKDDPILLQWQLKAASAARQPEKAMKLRAELLPLLAVEAKNISDYVMKSPGTANREVANSCLLAMDAAAARTFARILAAEPISNDNNLELANLLMFLQDAKFIEEIDAALVKKSLESMEEWQLFHAHYPAAAAWHKMGQTEKAIDCYRDMTEENGWKKSSAEVARAWIAQWKKEAQKP